jgi:hypothetical protein
VPSVIAEVNVRLAVTVLPANVTVESTGPEPPQYKYAATRVAPPGIVLSVCVLLAPTAQASTEFGCVRNEPPVTA